MSRYIDADKLKEILYITANFVDVKKVFERYIDKTPTEDVKPVVRGEWICICGSSAVCNKCNRLNQMYGDFCKYCGADMRNESVENYSIKMVTNAKDAENYPVSEDISKKIEEINKLIFKNGQAESEEQI